MDWAKLSDEELLEKRICDLGVTIQGTELDSRVQELYKELGEKGIFFHPPCYLGDEWFTPEDVPAIAIPFYLAHPRLKKLEYKMMLEVEGESEEWCLRLLRHEAGHALNHAYHFYKQPQWQKLFGSPAKELTYIYKPRPYSRNYVIHLDNWYAQSHPEEDFAETFAVWLTPGLDWRGKYKGWKAFEKLNYVDQLMNDARGNPPLVKSGPKIYDAARLKSKLKTFYQRRRKILAQDYPWFYDTDLKRIFSDDPSFAPKEKASRFMKHHHKTLLDTVSRWTGEKKINVNRLLKDLSQRCDELSLRVHQDDSAARFELLAYLTTLVTHYRVTGKFKHQV